MRAGSPTTLLVNTRRYPIGRSVPEDCYDPSEDPSNEHKPLLTQSDHRNAIGPVLYRKLSGVNWRNVLTIFLTVVDYFLVYASISLIGAFFPNKALDKGASSLEIGIIIGIASLTLTIFAPIVGYFLPKLGIKSSMITGLIIVGGTYIALGATIYVPSGWPFIVVCSVLRFTEGVGTALYNTAAYTLVNKLYPESIGFVMGLMEIGSGLGYASGPVVGGYLYLAGGYRLPFFVIGGLCIVFTLPTLLLLKSTSGSSQVLNLRMVVKLLGNFVFFLLLLSTVLQMAGVGFTVGTLAIFLKNQFSLTPEKIGLVFLSNSVLYIIAAPIAGKIADKINPRWLIVIGLFLSAVGFLFVGPASLFPFKPVLWLTIVALVVMGSGSGIGLVAAFPDVSRVSLSSLPASDTEDTDALYGVIAGLISGGMSFGEFLGPVIGGGLTHVINFQDSAFLYGEVLLALMVLILGVSLVHKCFDVPHKYKTKKVLNVQEENLEPRTTVKEDNKS